MTTADKIKALPDGVRISLWAGHTQLVEKFNTDDLKTLVAEVADWEEMFDMWTAAERRGLEMWRAEKPEERKLRMPDTAHFVAWLLNRVEFDETVFAELRDENARLVSELETKTRALEAYANPDNWQNSTGPDERELRDQIVWRVPEDGFALAQAALRGEK